VTRRIGLDLKEGQNEVTIKNLPTVLDGDSIRVDGIGKAVVFDVVYSNYPPNPSYFLINVLFRGSEQNSRLGELPRDPPRKS
jgi:hypothetical protein